MEVINCINDPFIMTGSCQWFVKRIKLFEAVVPVCICWLCHINFKAMFWVGSGVQKMP
jgi:hypothetical protein